MNLEKFTDRAKGFLQAAQTVAIRMNHQRITPLHLLKALLEDSEGMASGLIQRAGELAPVVEDAIHSLKGEPGVIDIRNIGLAAAIDLEPVPGKVGLRALQTFEVGLEEGVLLRFTADTIAMGPPFISMPDEIAAMVDMLRRAIRKAFARTATV